MYVTMNRFKIKKEYAKDYLSVWKKALPMVQDVDGFIDFKFFKADHTNDDYVLFSSYALWESKEKFICWTKSEHFKHSHRTGDNNREMYLERPELECFEVMELTL